MKKKATLITTGGEKRYCYFSDNSIGAITYGMRVFVRDCAAMKYLDTFTEIDAEHVSRTSASEDLLEAYDQI